MLQWHVIGSGGIFQGSSKALRGPLPLTSGQLFRVECRHFRVGRPSVGARGRVFLSPAVVLVWVPRNSAPRIRAVHLLIVLFIVITLALASRLAMASISVGSTTFPCPLSCSWFSALNCCLLGHLPMSLVQGNECVLHAQAVAVPLVPPAARAPTVSKHP